MNSLSLVSDFHRLFRIHDPKEPDFAAFDLRVRLLREEADEFYSATTLKDKLDALADLLYVQSGAILQLGLCKPYSAIHGARYPMPFQVRQSLTDLCDRMELSRGCPESCAAVLADFDYEIAALVRNCGFETIFEEAFERVHESNMLPKLWTGEEVSERLNGVNVSNEPLKIDQHRSSTDHILAGEWEFLRHESGKWVAKCAGKVRKSRAWKEPVFDDLLDQLNVTA